MTQGVNRVSASLPDEDGFWWGAATAAYQVEGSVDADGRGRSIWDTFCERPGSVADGTSGAVPACASYRRWDDDVALLSGLGANAYRFSVAWPRIQPEGTGQPDHAGLAYYDRLVDGLLEAGVAPVATLFHWDLPQALQDTGGWMSREVAARFADYAALVAERLGDRVAAWATLNEPFVHMAFGYAFGTHAPGETRMLGAAPAGHHQLLGHGLAAQALRAAGVSGAVGLVDNLTPVRTRSDDPGDAEAAAAYDAIHNGFFLEPVLAGRYPDLVGELLGDVVADTDLATIAQPLDVLGVNYYQPTWITAPSPDNPLPFEIVVPDDLPTTGFGWPVAPDGLPDLLVGLRDRYAALPPLLVTENGCAYPDANPQGPYDDTERIAYLDAHVSALGDARAAGVDVRGYFCWSLMDNFEWAEGFTQRFGLVHVDLDTGTRTPRASYGWYRDRIARGW